MPYSGSVSYRVKAEINPSIDTFKMKSSQELIVNEPVVLNQTDVKSKKVAMKTFCCIN